MSPGESAGRVADSHRVRHHNAALRDQRRPSKLGRQAAQFIETPKAAKRLQCARWLREMASSITETTSAGSTESARSKRNRCRGSIWRGNSGRRYSRSWSRGARFGGQTRFMALGDYANSRGASDMGLLPERLPGYAHASDAAARARLASWGRKVPDAPGLTAAR
jgi:hypothetical protein